MLTLSTSERLFIEDGVALGCRADGRGCLARRSMSLKCGVLDSANGSALLKLSQTHVLVGVKADITAPMPGAADRGMVVVNVECCPSAAPEFEGRGGQELNRELACVVEKMISCNMDLKSLVIIEGEQCWRLNIDAVVLESGGNLFDAITFAARAALYNTRLPRIEVVSRGEGQEIELSDDPLECTSIDVSSVPLCITLVIIGEHFVVDATLEEEVCMKARVSVAVNSDGKYCGVEKGGKGGVDPSKLCEVLHVAQKLGSDWLREQEALLRQEEDREKMEGRQRSANDALFPWQ